MTSVRFVDECGRRWGNVEMVELRDGVMQEIYGGRRWEVWRRKLWACFMSVMIWCWFL